MPWSWRENFQSFDSQTVKNSSPQSSCQSRHVHADQSQGSLSGQLVSNEQVCIYSTHRQRFIFVQHSHDTIHARVTFHRRVKDGKNIAHKHTQFIKVKLYEKFVTSKLWLSYMYFSSSPVKCSWVWIFFCNGGRSSGIWFESSFRQEIGIYN